MKKTIHLFCLLFLSQIVLCFGQALNPNFGNNGVSYFQINESFIQTMGYGLTRQSDGKLIVAGTRTNGNNFVSTDVLLVRFQVDGSIDAGFGNNGIVTIDNFANADEFTYKTLVLPDDKILVLYTGRGLANGFKLRRLNNDGSLDSSFNPYDLNSTITFSNLWARDMAIDSRGRIVVGGYVQNGSGLDGSFELARFTTDGQLDNTFGNFVRYSLTTPGSVVTEISNIAIVSDDKIVCAGSKMIEEDLNMYLFRIDSSGIIDASFGNGGSISYCHNDTLTLSNNMAIGNDGAIFVTCTYPTPSGGSGGLVAAFEPDGSLRLSFGTGGIKDISTVNSNILDVRGAWTNADGKVYLASAQNNGFTKFISFIRLNPDGGLDITFGNSGIFNLFESSDAAPYQIIAGNINNLYLLGIASGVVNNRFGIVLAEIFPDQAVSIKENSTKQNTLLITNSNQLESIQALTGEISIFDALGRKVYNKRFQNEMVNINLREFEKGILFISFQTPNSLNLFLKTIN